MKAPCCAFSRRRLMTVICLLSATRTRPLFAWPVCCTSWIGRNAFQPTFKGNAFHWDTTPLKASSSARNMLLRSLLLAALALASVRHVLCVRWATPPRAIFYALGGRVACHFACGFGQKQCDRLRFPEGTDASRASALFGSKRMHMIVSGTG